MTKSTESKDSPTDTDFVPPAEQRFQFALSGQDLQFNTIKCNPCNQVTPHQWLMVQVEPSLIAPEKFTVLTLNEMARRLILCQNCGNIRLIK